MFCSFIRKIFGCKPEIQYVEKPVEVIKKVEVIKEVEKLIEVPVIQSGIVESDKGLKVDVSEYMDALDVLLKFKDKVDDIQYRMDSNVDVDWERDPPVKVIPGKLFGGILYKITKDDDSIDSEKYKVYEVAAKRSRVSKGRSKK